jgi:hypothetical protein
MATTPNATPEINLDDINKELAAMSPEEKQAELLKFRVRQKKQQKKQQGSGAQKKYQLQQRARMKALKEEAIRLGIWDKINEQAEDQAEKELAGEEVETSSEENEEVNA